MLVFNSVFLLCILEGGEVSWIFILAYQFWRDPPQFKCKKMQTLQIVCIIYHESPQPSSYTKATCIAAWPKLYNTGNVKRGQDCTQSCDKQMITQLIEQEERVKNISEFLKKKKRTCIQICLKECCLKTNLSKGPRNKTEEKTRKESSKGYRRNLKKLLS